jgi:hypothetical protein
VPLTSCLQKKYIRQAFEPIQAGAASYPLISVLCSLFSDVINLVEQSRLFLQREFRVAVHTEDDAIASLGFGGI